MGKTKLTNTPYDDVFRTLLNDCSRLMIPMINEAFGECYSGDETIVFSPNEHFLNRQDGNEEERITDTCFLVMGKEQKKYHWECQSSADSSMLTRFFEYDAQIALDAGVIDRNMLSVLFPYSAALFLRCDTATQDQLKIKIATSGNGAAYDIPVMKVQRYTLDEIFAKNLLFLIPFYIFTHEDRFKKYERDAAALAGLENEYGQIRGKLDYLLEKKEIDEYTKCTLIDMTNKVLGHIAKEYASVREGVESVMGGRVLDYEAKTIKNEEREEGIKKLVTVLKDLNIPPQTILTKVQEQYGLSQEASKQYL